MPLILAGILALYVLRWILLPFVVAGVIAYVITPLIGWVQRRTGWPRAVPAVMIFLIFLSTTGVTGYFAGSALFREAKPLLVGFQGTLERTLQRILGDGMVPVLGESMDAHQIAERIGHYAQNALDPERVLTLATFGVTGAFAVILFFVMFIYFLLTGPKVADGLLWLVPPQHRAGARRLWLRVDPLLKRYFVGIAIVVLCTTVLAYLGLGIALRLPHAVFLSVMTGCLEIVPVVGPASSAAIAGLVAIQSAKGLTAIVAYAVYAAALRIFIDNLLSPMILGQATRVHPVMVIFAFLVGGYLFGIVGVVLAVPAVLVVRTLLATWYGELDEAET